MMIDELFKYYLAHQDELVKRYDGKYLVITANGVQGAYDSMAEGYDYALKTFGKGNFMLQFCTEGDRAYSQRFYTYRVSF